MAISPVYEGTIYDPTATATRVTGTDSGMGMDAFLTMFTAQLTNQNPLNPMDNTEFTAQLAQFSQLEQLTQISDSMESLDTLTQTISRSSMASYLGKEVTMTGDSIAVHGDHIGTLRFTLDESASVRALVIDESGSIVDDVDLGTMSSGVQEFTWDGIESSGQAADDGAYRISLVAVNRYGDLIDTGTTQVSGIVTGYATDEDGANYLLVGDTALPYESILAVEEPSSASSAERTLAQQQAREELEEMNQAIEDAQNGDDGVDLTDVLSVLGNIGGLAALLI